MRAWLSGDEWGKIALHSPSSYSLLPRLFTSIIIVYNVYHLYTRYIAQTLQFLRRDLRMLPIVKRAGKTKRIQRTVVNSIFKEILVLQDVSKEIYWIFSRIISQLQFCAKSRNYYANVLIMDLLYRREVFAIWTKRFNLDEAKVVFIRNVEYIYFLHTWQNFY